MENTTLNNIEKEIDKILNVNYSNQLNSIISFINYYDLKDKNIEYFDDILINKKDYKDAQYLSLKTVFTEKNRKKEFYLTNSENDDKFFNGKGNKDVDDFCEFIFYLFGYYFFQNEKIDIDVDYSLLQSFFNKFFHSDYCLLSLDARESLKRFFLKIKKNNITNNSLRNKLKQFLFIQKRDYRSQLQMVSFFENEIVFIDIDEDNDYNNKIYRFENNLKNKIIMLDNFFESLKYKNIKYDDTFINLKDLWMYQFKKEKFYTPKEEKDVLDKIYKNNYFAEIVNNVNDSKTTGFTNRTKDYINYNDLLVFYKEVQNKKITNKSNKFQTFLCSKNKDINDLLKLIVNDNNIERINNIEKINRNSSTFKKIYDELDKDKHFNIRKEKITIYKLNQKAPKVSTNAKYKKVSGIHGTKLQSIIPIIFNGLQYEKEKLVSDYKYTASGLGKGIYFARTYQCSKSMNYVGSSKKSNFLFLCDVYYKNKKTVTSYTSNYSSGYDLIYGKCVGIRNGYDEILAKNTNNIHLKYLICYEK